MGKLKMDLLKGIEAEERAIETEKKQKPLTANEEKILEAYNRGITSPTEIGKKTGINRGTVSKALKRIKGEYPELITVQAEPEHGQERMDAQDAPQAPRQPHIATKAEKANISPQAEEKPENKANTKQKKQVFSFRARPEDIATWKAYATAAGQTMEIVGAAAMNEYVSGHELTDAEKAIFEAMKARRKSE